MKLQIKMDACKNIKYDQKSNGFDISNIIIMHSLILRILVQWILVIERITMHQQLFPLPGCYILSIWVNS
jgi:hypothetical protein